MDLDSSEASDFELDAVEALISQIDAESTVEDMKRTLKRGVDGHKHSFLHRFMDH